MSDENEELIGAALAIIGPKDEARCRQQIRSMLEILREEVARPEPTTWELRQALTKAGKALSRAVTNISELPLNIREHIFINPSATGYVSVGAFIDAAIIAKTRAFQISDQLEGATSERTVDWVADHVARFAAMLLRSEGWRPGTNPNARLSSTEDGDFVALTEMLATAVRGRRVPADQACRTVVAEFRDLDLQLRSAASGSEAAPDVNVPPCHPMTGEDNGNDRDSPADEVGSAPLRRE
jgi:hypothetical protein